MDRFLSESKDRFNIDLKILIPSILISIIGVVTLLSTTILPNGTFGDRTVVTRQIIFILVGYFLYFIMTKIDLSYTKYWQVILPIYIGTLILLILVLAIGPVINNVQRWLVIGGIQIQPSEFAKITVVFLTAFILSQKDKYNQWVLLIISLLLILPIVVLVYMEPDGSMSVLLLMIWFFVAFTGLDNQLRNTVAMIIVILGTLGFLISAIVGNLIWLLLVLVALIVSIFAFYYRDQWRLLIIISFLLSILLGIGSGVVWDSVLKDYQKERIEVFLDPTKDTGDAGFNVNQAKIAIGSGQIWGKGFGNGTQSKRSFLPEYRTDFIFASFAEEFGLVGSVFLLLLFSVIILTGLIRTISLGSQPFFAMLMIGFTVKLLLEVFINIGTNTGVIPATGIPLPLVSAGGSSIIVTLFSLGVIQSIISHSIQVDDSEQLVQTYEN
ncbi:MAG: Rod shape-determining protein RodA [candidate division WS6 bacterium 34_10]|uniref:Probable peptidoglycan glycosyltransferase FtsW n=1 Tax=candidate division WS6 bacterium 34_10 TaxID=1641389 RepID=A0A101HHA5_9BACT|nr:MAG: Rod shape-determining protein RodA [candidate division WS6 bacterium 34_10]